MNDRVGFSATELVTKMHACEIGAVELLNAHAQVIEASNPDINALVTLCLERAVAEAKLADRRSAKNESMGVLHGLPYAVKDTLPTKDAHHIRLVVVRKPYSSAGRVTRRTDA